MPVFKKARTSDDIINGIVTVGAGAGIPQKYDDTQRTQHWASGDSWNLAQVLDTRYKKHGGAGGSGNWEH